MTSRTDNLTKSEVLKKPSICVIGASGFIGKHLLKQLRMSSGFKIRALARKPVEFVGNSDLSATSIEWIRGDLFDIQALEKLIENDSIVINLAYLNAQDNLQAIRNLAQVCQQKKVNRLIHISTATVAGHSDDEVITEKTQCRPTSFYEKNKLEIENILLEKAKNNFAIFILRPTAVFGPDGQNLVKIFQQLKNRPSFLNYLKSCLLYNRSLNLVSVQNVVAALLFLTTLKKELDQQVFLISDDQSPLNNYRAVEDRFLKKLNKPYLLPRLNMPRMILAIFLKVLNKSNPNPAAKYSDQKIVSLGFVKTKDFEQALDQYTEWFLNRSVIK